MIIKNQDKVNYVRFKNSEQLEFERLKRLRVEARFDDPQATGDFGAILLRELENRLDLSSKRNKSHNSACSITAV